MGYLFENYATGSLAVAIDSVDTQLNLQVGEGSLFPTPSGSDTFSGVLEDTNGNYEFVEVTARTNDLLTITRGQQGTVARAFDAGTHFELRLTKRQLDNFLQKTGGVMAGDLNMNNFSLLNAVLSNINVTGGTLKGVILRGADNGVANELVVPSAGGAPTIGGQNIWHAGNFTPGNYAPVAHTHAAADIVSGTLADARVAESNVTQHKLAVNRLPVSAKSNGYAVVAGDLGTKMRFTSASGIACTLGDIGEVGDMVFFSKGGDGDLTIQQGTSTTFLKSGGTTGNVVIGQKYAVAGFHKVAAGQWEVTGVYT